MAITSPPASPQPGYKKSYPYTLIRSALKPLWIEMQHRRAVRKYAHHADSRSFDWDWDSLHFNRIALVNLLLSKKENPAYLEIGCASNTLFDSVHAMNKIGVDPAAGGTVRDTSDRFFESNRAKFDVVFIDGLHTYEQARRDVVNSIRFLNAGGWIAMHDMLPRTWIEHHVPDLTRKGDAWTGDVWKVAFELAETEGLDFRILRIDRGICVIKVMHSSVVLKDLFSQLRDKEFAYYYDNIGKLPIVEWDEVQGWLRS